MMFDTIVQACGLLGNALFAVACITMAANTIMAGKDIGTPMSTMWTFFVATVAFGVYLFGAFGFHLFFGCMAIETACWAIALWYHYFPRITTLPNRNGIDQTFDGVYDFCTRGGGHPGPCNGLPMGACLYWDDTVGYARPLKDIANPHDPDCGYHYGVPCDCRFHKLVGESPAAYRWRIYGPCAPQCMAECDGVCANAAHPA